MIPKKILKHLDEKKIGYELIEHKKVYTAYDAAATMRIPLEKITKWLLVKVGNNYAIAIVAANQNIDLKKLAKVAKVAKVDLPKENIMKTKFKVTPGAMSAFGSIYQIPVFLDKKIANQKDAIFSAGSFTESLNIKIKDFINAECPVIGIFGVAKKVKPPKSLLKKKKAPRKPKKKPAKK